MVRTFSIQKAFADGWTTAQAHRGILIKVILTIAALELISTLLKGVTVLNHSVAAPTSLLIFVIGILVALCTTGLLSICIKLVRGEAVSYRDIVPPWHIVWRFLLVSIVSGVLTMVGFILLIIPGIYLVLRLSFAKFVVIERPEAGVFDALRISGELTKGVKWKLLAFFLLVILINILGALALTIGLLITVPMSLLATAHIYVLLSRASAPALSTVPPPAISA